MKLKPLADKIVLKMCEVNTTTKSGIVLTSTTKEKPQMAEVIAVGTGGIVDGKEIIMNVSVGDKVVINKYSGSEVKINEDEFIIIRMSDILAIVE